jgi:UDP-N-acetylglucosamine:LPS N-acetylglucosamine transferase
MKPYKFILSLEAEQGGHIYPAIAIANELKLQFPRCRDSIVGANDKMECKSSPSRLQWTLDLRFLRTLTFSVLYFHKIDE